MLSRGILVLVCLVALPSSVSSSRKVLENQIRTPNIDMINMQENNLHLFLGQDLSIKYPWVYSQFEYRIMERLHPASGNLVDDYQIKSDYYEESSLCTLEESNFKIDVNAEHQFQAKDLRQMEIDTNRNTIYILTGQSEIYAIEYEGLQNGFAFKNVEYKLQLGEVDPNASIHYENTTTKHLFVLTSEGLYSINPDQNMPTLEPVAGMKSNLVGAKPIWQGKYLLLNYRNKIGIYIISGPKQVQLIQTIQNYDNSKIAIADAMLEGVELWLLDEQFGIYYFTSSQNTFTQKQSYRMRFGRNIFFRKYHQTVQVVFQNRKNTYVAELSLLGDDMFLNRFYTQVPGIRDIMFSNELMIVVGDEQAMIIQHSISLYSLKHYLVRQGSWQKKQFINTYGVREVKTFDLPGFTSEQNTYFIALESSTLKVHVLKRNFASLHCNLSNASLVGRHSIYVSINATNCKRDTSNISIARFCMIEQSLNFNLAKPKTKSVSIVVSYSLLGAASFIGLVICICCLRCRARKKYELEQLRGVLRRKMEDAMYRKVEPDASAIPDASTI